MQNATTGVLQAIGKTSIVTWYDEYCFKCSFAKRNLILLKFIGGKIRFNEANISPYALF